METKKGFLLRHVENDCDLPIQLVTEGFSIFLKTFFMNEWML